MRELSLNEANIVSGGFYFTSPLIGAAIGGALSNGNPAAIALGSGISAILLTPYCPLHWAYGLGAIATGIGLAIQQNPPASSTAAA